MWVVYGAGGGYGWDGMDKCWVRKNGMIGGTYCVEGVNRGYCCSKMKFGGESLWDPSSTVLHGEI
jgi:hypothetical protein